MDIEEYLSFLTYYERDGQLYRNHEEGKARKLATLNTFFGYYHKKGMIEKNAPSVVDVPRVKEKNIIRLDANEVAQQTAIYLPKIMECTPPNIYEEAIPATQKSSPSYARNALLGAMLLAVVYCGFLVVRYLMNDSFTTPEDIERYFGIQPLAVVPEGAFKSDKGRHSRKIADEQEPHKKA